VSYTHSAYEALHTPRVNDPTRQFADGATQKDAIAKVIALGTAKVPLLLSWAVRPAADLSGLGGYLPGIALADISGQLKTREEIPTPARPSATLR
jgi:hypothetical protein